MTGFTTQKFSLLFHAWHAAGTSERQFDLHITNPLTGLIFGVFCLHRDGSLIQAPEPVKIKTQCEETIFYEQFEIDDDILLTRTIPIAHWVNACLAKVSDENADLVAIKKLDDVFIFKTFDDANIKESRPSLRQFCQFKGSPMHNLVVTIGRRLFVRSRPTIYTNSEIGFQLDNEYLGFQVNELCHSFKAGSVYPHW